MYIIVSVYINIIAINLYIIIFNLSVSTPKKPLSTTDYKYLSKADKNVSDYMCLCVWICEKLEQKQCDLRIFLSCGPDSLFSVSTCACVCCRRSWGLNMKKLCRRKKLRWKHSWRRRYLSECVCLPDTMLWFVIQTAQVVELSSFCCSRRKLGMVSMAKQTGCWPPR